MVDIDQIRRAQEQRLSPLLNAWEDAKRHLEEAMAQAKAREEDFREVSEDVRRRLHALDLVADMANGMEIEAPSGRVREIEGNRPILIASENTHGEIREDTAVTTSSRGFRGLLRKSSRPLFPNLQRRA